MTWLVRENKYKFENDHIRIYGSEIIELEGGIKERETVFEFTCKNMRGKLAELKKRIKI